MTLALTDVATAIGSAAAAPPVRVSGWSVDSRTVGPGELYFALRGPNHDGHEFVSEALGKGAAAAVIDRPLEAGGNLLPVADSHEALQKLASWARRRWGGTVVGITGSAGKTTTKDTIAHLLASRMSVGKTTGNYNNHVGVPLSILRLPDESRVAVLELGMNHAGEIRNLARIARPAIGVVTNVGYAHIENFDSIDGVALAKRELIESLPPDGTAVLNADDPRVAGFRQVHGGEVITFGFSEDADVRAGPMERQGAGTRFHVRDSGWFETPLGGRHGVTNILAAMAVGRVFGFAPEQFADAVRTLEAGEMRGKRLARGGVTIFNDCYNSNPEAVRAMLELLTETPARRRIAVLGEMLELGRWAETLHREIGSSVARCGVNVLMGIRGAARHMADAAVEAGLPAGAAYFFEDPVTAGDHLRQLAREGDAILFKGSRGTHVERALERFLE